MTILIDILGYIFIEIFLVLILYFLAILLWFVVLPVVVILAFPFIGILAIRREKYTEEFKRLYIKLINKWIDLGFDLIGNKYRKIR
jgi:hypothetical protein